jgi:hypothetical protein
MAFSPIENKYLSALTALQFPPEQIEVNPNTQPGDVLLAAGPSNVVSDAGGAAFGIYPGMGKRSQKSDIGEKMITGAPDFAAGTARGAATSALGFGGDIQKIGRFINALATDNQGGGIMDKLGRAAETMADPTFLPSSIDVSEGGYTIPGTSIKLPGLPAAVPAGTSAFGMTPEERQKAAELGQNVGELVGDPFMAVKAGQMAVKGVVGAGKALAPKAAEMTIDMLEKSGMPARGLGIVQSGPSVQKIDGGIKFPVEDSTNRLRLKVQREQQALQGKAMPGMPKNERIVIEAPAESEMPDFVVGKITTDDWVTRTEAILSPEEIKQYAKWYEDVRGTFLKYTDGDEAKTDKYMRAWLVANQNIGVDGAFNNVLLQAEQFARQVPAGEMKAAGLPLATKAARSTLQDEPIVEGVGLKISDFVDSAEGKSVRSIYGNDPLAGQPFVVDIHTARDTGLVDEILLNHLERQGYKVDRDRITTDLAGGPTDTQYENRSDFGRKLTEELNSISWQGRNDWQPKEVQAVGWMAMTRLTADAADDTVTALERSLRRISMEAAPGEGSPWATKYGEAFNALTGDRQAQLTKAVTDRAMQMAREIAGIDLRSIVHGTGGWQNYQNPTAVAQTLATRSGAEIAANVVGYLTQQTEVWVNSIKGTTKNPKALAIDFIESGSDNLSTNEGLRSFWTKIMEADTTGLFVGYHPFRTMDGEVGIRVVIDKGGADRMQSVQDVLSTDGPIDKMISNLGYDIKARGYEADLVKARNDWTGKGSKNGETYLGRLADLGVKRTAADLDPLRGELEAIFERELSGAAKSKTSTSGTGTAGSKPKTKVTGSPLAPQSGAK